MTLDYEHGTHGPPAVTSTTAPDFRGPARDLPRLDAAPGTTLDLLVVAFGGTQCVGVDLATGVLVRGWSPAPPHVRPQAYDVVEVILGGNRDVLPDPTAPEALPLVRPPKLVGRLKGRRAERLLRPLSHPLNVPLLGFRASTIRFYERTPDRPSIALVEPHGPIGLYREDDYLACRFAWQGKVQELPCLDRLVAARLDRTGRVAAQGNRGDRLVVALTPPLDGHCHKVVQAILPRP